MQPVQLHFHGPYSLCGETVDVLGQCEHRNSGGLYLWVAEQETCRYKATYLGETSRSFYGRTKEHIIQTLGGNYRVIDADEMRRGVERIVWDGMWRRGTRHRLPEFLSRHDELFPLIKSYLSRQTVFLAPLKAEQRLRRRIEGALALHLRCNPSAATLFPGDIRYHCRIAEETSIRVTISADVQIEGLPTELMA